MRTPTQLPIGEIDRRELPSLRVTMAQLGVVVAEIDRELRYTWIDNPHPDFSVAKVVGRRDDELIPKAEAAGLMALKQSVFDTAAPGYRVFRFSRSDGLRYYSVGAYPIRSDRGEIDGVVTVGFETPAPEPI